jgi:hypothetical protein
MNFYTSFMKKLSDNDVDYAADTIKVEVMTSSYTFSAAHDFADDLSAEVSGTNYTSGGPTLSTKTTSAANPCVWDADDVTFAQSGSGFSNGRGFTLYKSTGTASTSPLICNHTAGSDFGNVAGSLTIQWSASGIVRVAG